MKQHWLEIIVKIGCSNFKVSPTEYYYIYYIYNTDWLCAPFFLNYFESEWFYRDEPFTKNVSFGGARKKSYIFKIGEQSL